MSSPEGSSVTFRRASIDIRPRAIQAFARKLESEVAKGRPFDTLITGDSELQRLNREFRGKDYATDVLSFPASLPPLSRDRQEAESVAALLMRTRRRSHGPFERPATNVIDLLIHGAR